MNLANTEKAETRSDSEQGISSIDPTQTMQECIEIEPSSIYRIAVSFKIGYTPSYHLQPKKNLFLIWGCVICDWVSLALREPESWQS
jgi:hypothetical protein